MRRQTLLETDLLDVKTIDVEGIRAEFRDQLDGSCDVVIEINSQKFLINIVEDDGFIEKFEIVAVKGFIINLTNTLISALKKLIEQLQLALI